MTREEQIAEAAMLEAYKRSNVEEAYGCELDFAAGARWADENPRWVSVEDALPPMESGSFTADVLVCSRFGAIGIDYYDYCSQEWYQSLEPITHWMPLPKLPIVANLGKSGKG